MGAYAGTIKVRVAIFDVNPYGDSNELSKTRDDYQKQLLAGAR